MDGNSHLSETPQGAGGVGGLLCIDSGNDARYYPAYDLNGNVIAYFDSNGQPAAHFQYDPFGNLTVDEYSNAADFPYRFSTKPQDPATGLYYYLYRYYDPVTGRWPSRDPIEEQGGVNLYGFVGNDGVNAWDYLGRVEMNLLPHDAREWHLINNWNISPNIYDVVAHGNTEWLVDSRNQRITPERLAKLIKNGKRNKYTGQLVQLWACNAGNDADGEPFAQKLADELCGPVKAPITLLNLRTRPRDVVPAGFTFYFEYMQTWPDGSRGIREAHFFMDYRPPARTFESFWKTYQPRHNECGCPKEVENEHLP
jgi:RHS repeat-associated protein